MFSVLCPLSSVLWAFLLAGNPPGVLEFRGSTDDFRVSMHARRYTFVIADRQTGAVRRLTISLWPTLAAVLGLFALPVLMGLGARWSASATLSDLQTTNATLQVENSSYREATGQLAGQISALQTAVDQLGERAAVDPTASRAMDKLPAIVKARAMGGSATFAAGRAAFSPMLSGMASTDAALGVLSDLLGVIGSRLDSVRDSVERRHALAAATPSVWPVAGWLTSSYGTRTDPFTNGAGFHPGLDISADYGQPVLATGEATVSSAGANGAYGNMVTLDHGFGIVTKYGHLSRIAVMADEHVKRGDVIGYVGSTGRSTGSHLHYEIWMNGRLTNPMTLLAR
jgi:murein DD-endopeptidase MepM/ murein hydrolase activator NlpD